jgi:Fe-S oxidoreductase
MQDAESIEVAILATACPFCEHNLKDGAKRIDNKISIVDIMDLLAQSLE